MKNSSDLYNVAFVEGEATITHEQLGTCRAKSGISFSDAAKITIRTGPSSRVIVMTPRGDAIEIGEMSSQVIEKHSSQDFIDTLRNLPVTARDMMASRRMVRLGTAVNR